MDNDRVIAALFDLDGVVFNTEPQYSVFWEEQGRRYHPEIPDLAGKIKGQTLVQIYDRYFKGEQKVQEKITEDLDVFETHMHFEYVEGFETFVRELRANGVKTAIVTSSNKNKMQNVYSNLPEFRSMFDAILTSENFKKSKPDPDCYLVGARIFDAKVDNCIVFEDSFNGLKSGRAAGMVVVGLSTTNSEELIKPLCDCVISNFKQCDYEKMCALIDVFN